MKVRSKGELVDLLSRFSKTRKRELITISLMLPDGREHIRLATRRAAVVLGYAHWEGFVREAAMAYVAYVSFISPVLRQLKPNFQALTCRTALLTASNATKKIQPHITVVTELTDRIAQRTRIDPNQAIDTESKLDAEVLENICATIGVDFEPWESLGPFINDLYETRCAIAHGELLKPNEKYVYEVLDFVYDSIDQFAAQVSNATVGNAFLRSA